MQLSKIVLVVPAALASVAATSPVFALKSIAYDGIECAYRNNNDGDHVWVPSTPGLYGFNATVTYCPIVQQAAEKGRRGQVPYCRLGPFLTFVRVPEHIAHAPI